MIRFSQNLLEGIQPRAMTRDIDWGIPCPLDGWRDQPSKRLYVWFDAVIGYLSASIEWARRSGDPEAWRRWWNDPDGALVVLLHGQGQHHLPLSDLAGELLGYDGRGDHDGEPGDYGALNLPTEVVSGVPHDGGPQVLVESWVVIYVRDVLDRYDADALRYFIGVAGPETHDTDFTWAEFVRRTNDELVAGWGNLVNRDGVDGAPGTSARSQRRELDAVDDRRCSRAVASRVRRVGGADRDASAAAGAITEAMRVSARSTSTSPTRRRGSSDEPTPSRLATILHVAAAGGGRLQPLLTPFLPHAAQQVDARSGATAAWSPCPGSTR